MCFELHILLVFLCIMHASGQASTYTCTAGAPCMVDCTHVSNFQCNTGGTGISTIDALDATNLEVFCYEPNACSGMLIECPITSSTESFCTVNCDLDNSCHNVELHTHNNTNVTLACGANENDRDTASDTQCKNVTIDGYFGYKNDIAPVTQNITIICNDEGNTPTDTPDCDTIVTENIAQLLMDTVIANSVVTLNILCTVNPPSDKEETQVCNHMNINGGKAKYVNIYAEGDISNSHFNLTDLALLQVTIDLVRHGTVWNTSIIAPEVQNKLYINSSSTIGFLNSAIIGSAHTLVEIETYYPSRLEASTFEGRFYITGNGYLIDCVFSSLYEGATTIDLGELGVWERNQLLIGDNADTNNTSVMLTFFGTASGYINARNVNMLSVICKSYYTYTSCDGLLLSVPPYIIVENIKKQRAFLECIDYGCTNVSIESEHGIDDIAVTAVLCDCVSGGNGESGNSCIGEINIGCGSQKATFDGEVCSGPSECCGAIVEETRNALCKNVNQSSGMSDWEIVGVFIGVLFALLLLTSGYCYCVNQRMIRDHIKTTQDTNPYVMEQGQQDTDEQKAGYGATTDKI